MELGPGERTAGPWHAEEVPFLREDQPWQRAHFIVGSASSVPHDPEIEVAVSPPLAHVPYRDHSAGD